jgi:putative hydrolase of the HAD superfamily
MHLITNGFEATQHQKLQLAGIDHFFDTMITSEAAMSIKPEAAIFQYALAEAGASAATSVMIGDAWDIDIVGARDVGMAQVYFNPKRLAVTEKPTFEIHCLSELIQLF